MTVNELLQRARTAAGQGIKYKLGAGGINPIAPSPANLNRECDCSGYVCWCLGISRQTTHPLYVNFNGGWINTDAMVHDGLRQSGFFEQLTVPKVGCLVVFPSSPPRVRVGHVGIVTAVSSAGAVTRVIHCSKGNFTAFQDAVRETPPTVFNNPRTIYVWYAGLQEG